MSVIQVDTVPILSRIEADLKNPRVLQAQVLTYIAEHYGIQAEDLQGFFTEKVPLLEDYELDLIFSPLFTPTLQDREVYGPLLQAAVLSRNQIDGFVDQMEAKQLQTTLLGPDGTAYDFPLKEVSLSRYVRRLFLDKPISSEVYSLIQTHILEMDQGLINMLVRDEIWQEAHRQTILQAFLRLGYNEPSSSSPMEVPPDSFITAEKLISLTDFVRTYRPGSLADLNRQLESLIKSCETDLEKVQSRRYHDAELMERYSESDVARVRDEQVRVMAHYHHMSKMAKILQEDCQTLLN